MEGQIPLMLYSADQQMLGWDCHVLQPQSCSHCCVALKSHSLAPTNSGVGCVKGRVLCFHLLFVLFSQLISGAVSFK